MREEIDNNTMIVMLTLFDRTSKQKINKGTQTLKMTNHTKWTQLISSGRSIQMCKNTHSSQEHVGHSP